MLRPIATLLLALLFLTLHARAALAAEITVNSTVDAVDDAGNCTLRAAILAANTDAAVGGCAAGAGTDTILFNIPGAGPHTIALQAALPAISAPLVIDGYSQPGAQVNTNPAGEAINAILMIVLDGDVRFQRNALSITGGGSTVRGLVFNHHRDAIRLSGAGGNKIEGNFIGTDAAGLSAARSSRGVSVESSGHTIGGSDPAARNLISGNHDGVSIRGDDAFFNRVEGNLIGTDRSGAAALPNTRSGVEIAILAHSNTVVGNVIAGNQGWGVLVDSQAADNVISGNWIGTNPAGDALGNELNGVLARNSGPQIIGGTYTEDGCCEGNVIAYNGRSGVGITAGGNASWFKGILSNRIYDNQGLGIDLRDDGVTPNDPGDADGENDANHLQNFPVLETGVISGTQLVITGTLDSTAETDFRLEFFANDACDPSGYGEGQRYLGAHAVTSDAAGQVSFSVVLTGTAPGLVAVGNALTSTATTSAGDTSEFSQCVTATGEGQAAGNVLYLPVKQRSAP